jgi:cytochrome P450
MQMCPVSHEFDPFGDAFQHDPAAAFRREGAVFYSEPMGWYVVTGYDDIRAVFRDTESFSSSIFAEPMAPLCDRAVATLAEYGYRPSRSLVTLDPPLHPARRKLMHQPFKPVSTDVWEPRVREIHLGYIEAMAGRGRADLIGDYFWEAPAVVALEFMGIPDEEVAKVKQFAAGVLNFIFGRPSEDEQVAVCDLIGRHQQYSRGLIERLRASTLEESGVPQADQGVLPHAIGMRREHPDVIDDDFLFSLAYNTLSAAHETTSTSLANAMVVLLEERSRWEMLCADPSLIPNAVEECLRYAPSLTTNRRLCIKDTEIAGVPIPAGARLLLGISAANRDPSVFDDPDRFDLERKTAKRHLTFGVGPHTCLGAPLARLQMRIALEELTQRLPGLRLVADQAFEYVPTASARAPRAVEVEWTLS